MGSLDERRRAPDPVFYPLGANRSNGNPSRRGKASVTGSWYDRRQKPVEDWARTKADRR